VPSLEELGFDCDHLRPTVPSLEELYFGRDTMCGTGTDHLKIGNSRDGVPLNPQIITLSSSMFSGF
jgi:hypothetical protein